MPWVKLDDNFHRNPKARLAGLRGRALYIAGLCHCAQGLTDGTILKAMLPIIAAEAEVTVADAVRLVELGLWQEHDDHYTVNDYLEWNPSGEQVRATRAARSAAGRRGGTKSKVAGAGRSNDEATDEANGKQTVKQMLEQVLEPQPSKPEANSEANRQAKRKPNGTPYPYPYPTTTSCSLNNPGTSELANDTRWQRIANTLNERGVPPASTYNAIHKLIHDDGIADHLVDAAAGQTINKADAGLGYLITVSRNWQTQRTGER